MFSPKVLDRAFTLELNEVNLAIFGQREPKSDIETIPLYLQHFPGRLNYDHKPNTDDWVRFGKLLNGELQDVVVEFNALLRDARQNFGYRVATEIARFVNLAAEQTGGTEAALWTALDLAILQKVLPKFNGTQQELEEILSNLFVFSIKGKRLNGSESKDLLPEAWHMESGHLILNEFNNGEVTTQPQLLRTANKLWTMWNRLRKQGFTSYIS
jgi:5-methylcytosine-specific restriction enzyme B